MEAIEDRVQEGGSCSRKSRMIRTTVLRKISFKNITVQLLYAVFCCLHYETALLDYNLKCWLREFRLS